LDKPPQDACSPGPGDAAATALVFLLSLLFLFSFDPLSRPLGLDPATWDYMSVEVSRGLIPYRDIFLHKTPLAALLGSTGALAASAVGARPVAGVHLLFLLFAAAAPTLLFALMGGRRALLVALSSALFMLSADQWVVAAAEGARPKVVTVALGLAALLAARRGRPLVAGIAAGAATLCWQPGLCFLLGAAFELRRAPSSLLRLLAGTAAPVALLLAWLWHHAALADFFSQAVTFNFDYIAFHARAPSHSVARVLRHLYAWNRPEMLLLVPALLALFFVRRDRSVSGLAVATAAYLAMTLVSFQAWPDTLLLIPGMAAVLGAGLPRLFSLPAIAHLRFAVPLLALALAITPSRDRLSPPLDLATQQAKFQQLAGQLPPGARVIAVGVPELLLHLDRRNGWKWPYMWFGVDAFAAAQSGGMDALLADLDKDPPRLMVIGRRWHGPLRRDFDAWAGSRYSRQSVSIFPHTKRPLQVYRPLEPSPPAANPAAPERP